ncbi:L,D-transpeptidase family protein [Halomonas sp. TD01]|uniref:L,D-transpeptidase family protein n=1 Tax=Halomonas sp. TD01 TaxID=999141 RepID=UPI000214F57D|nr:L,D-transpeptidase family protein [Halomonas sp. TD01]EGP19498.1 ErfK/YbiS/YcfS/YnhG family protein [Halomonas sp. TD01]CAH1044934.1 L,D-transpeptidase [Halomonas sp. TD01]
MNIRKLYNVWGPTSFAVLLTASLSSPVYAQQSASTTEGSAALAEEVLASADQPSEQRELPRGHFRLPETGDIIGEHYTVVVEDPEETLIDIARRHNIGYEEIRMANPGVSLWVPGEGTEVVIPARYILPPAPREGVVVNLSELRLYYYPADNPGIVETYPVSVGREEFATPIGITRTTVKVKDPAWAPPASMRREAAARGEPAPSIVPAGPNNPLGRHAILLAMPSYLIHGTNRPEGVGMRVSRGCIRMFPEDIKSLYERLPSGTQVNLMDAPFKAGWAADGTLFVQSYPQLEENVGDFEPLLNAIERVSELAEEQAEVDYAQVKLAVENPDGRLIALYGPQAPAPAPAEEPVELDGLLEEIELTTVARGEEEA